MVLTLNRVPRYHRQGGISIGRSRAQCKCLSAPFPSDNVPNNVSQWQDTLDDPTTIGGSNFKSTASTLVYHVFAVETRVHNRRFSTYHTRKKPHLTRLIKHPSRSWRGLRPEDPIYPKTLEKHPISGPRELADEAVSSLTKNHRELPPLCFSSALFPRSARFDPA